MEYLIKSDVRMTPTVRNLYLDDDGALFIYIGDVSDNSGPWLEIMPQTTIVRGETYPVEPLRELSPSEYEQAIDKRLRGY